MTLVDVGNVAALTAAMIGAWGFVGLIKPKLFFGASRRGQVGLGFVGALVLFMVGMVFIGTHADEKKTAVASSEPAVQPVAAQVITPAPATVPAPQPVKPTPAPKPPAPQMPTDQASFIGAIANSQRAYHKARNEMAKGGTRTERRRAICASLKGISVQNWIGTVSQATSANDGRGVLAVRIGDSLQLATDNNSFSDAFFHTLIEPGSTLFKSAVELGSGDAVQFSGTFFQDDKDCIKEESLTLDGSMTEPEFLFRFTAVKKL